ncbi:hypothetical protein BBJ28_00002499 [Nothophytophthora sp. Chile5]|nr:hypothetical protein BBJ28_00002499 [Nothophytophthora sp. Chile5]
MSDDGDGGGGGSNTDARSDFSCSSVDQFLRDNGFSISGLEEGLSLLSGDDEELTSDADERPPPSVHVAAEFDSAAGDLSPLQMSAASLDPHGASSDVDSPRFVLLDDEDLLLVGEEREEQNTEASARQWPQTDSGGGDGTSERQEAETASVGDQHREGTADPQREGSRPQQMQEEGAGEASFEREEADEPLDRSMLFGGSEFSLSSIVAPVGGGSAPHSEQGEPQSASLSAASSGLEVAQESVPSTPGRRTPSFSSIYQMTPQQKAPASAVAAAASTRVKCICTALSNVHESAEEREQQRSSEGEGERRSGRSDERERGRWNQHLDTSRELSTEEVGEEKEKGSEGDDAVGTTTRGESRRSDTEEVEGDWSGLNDLLRKNGLPVVRFQRDGLGEALPDRESLFSVVHDFVVQLERKNEVRHESAG